MQRTRESSQLGYSRNSSCPHMGAEVHEREGMFPLRLKMSDLPNPSCQRAQRQEILPLQPSFSPQRRFIRPARKVGSRQVILRLRLNSGSSVSCPALLEAWPPPSPHPSAVRAGMRRLGDARRHKDSKRWTYYSRRWGGDRRSEELPPLGAAEGLIRCGEISALRSNSLRHVGGSTILRQIGSTVRRAAFPNDVVRIR